MFARAKQLPYILLATGLLVALMVLLFPNFVHAFIGEFVYKGFVIGFLGWIMSLAGNMLNYAINTFVVSFGNQFQGGVGFVVNETWATIRDLFNLTFIFGLVFIGFKMILRTDDSNSRKWLVSIILAALLVNFSLFITKFVIDFSNIVAVELINLGLSQPMPAGTAGADATIFRQDGNGINISSSMNDLMNIETVLSNNTNADEKIDYSFSLIFGTAIVFLVTTFVYISAALMLVIRAGVLVILMILSPFLFIGMVFPNLKGAASKLWNMLITRAMFAPIYIALLYITLSVAGGFVQSMGGNGDFANAFTASGDDAVTSTADVFGPFMIITALLVISLVAAQKLGAEGANSAIKVGNNLRRGAQKQVARGTIGASAAVARNTAGRAAYSFAQSNTGKRLASGGIVSRSIAGAANKVGSASFDPRSKKDGTLGAAKKGGFAANMEAKEKKEKARAKEVERSPYDSYGNPTEGFAQALADNVAYQQASNDKTRAETEKARADELVTMAEQELQTQIDTNANIISLKQEIADALRDGDNSKRLAAEQLLATEENRLRSEYRNNNKALYQRAQQASTSFATATKKEKDLKTNLEGSYQYANVTRLREQRIKEAQFWNNRNKRFGATTAGSIVGGAAMGAAMAGPVGAAVGAVVGAVLKSAVVGGNAEGADTQIGTLTKEYGKDGDKKVKNKEADNLLKELKKKMDEDGGGKDKDDASS